MIRKGLSDFVIVPLANSASAVMSSWSFTDPRMPTCMDLDVSISPSSIAFGPNRKKVHVGGRRADKGTVSVKD